ncbi:hypothetical protein [Desulfopila inferna]|uniref:hypothetical protein n=1 Tax=Desulfopila inferna TaxID=468528 RepID=UPI001965F9A6|nr:hypothetical protein [Desulfopila inferna]MBM9602675.1 hypothetical protein [Desulfopila inferna]
MNRKLFMSAIMCSFLFAAASIASATDFVSGNVNRTRSVNGTASVMLQYVSGSGCTWGNNGRPVNVWFTVPSAMNDQALAISLTAISLQKTVRAGIETCPTPGSETGTLSSLGLDN